MQITVEHTLFVFTYILFKLEFCYVQVNAMTF